MARRHEPTDARFAKLAPLLPPERPASGRPTKDHRTVVNAIPWRLKTGVPWRALPERYGPWEAVCSRFRRWRGPGSGTASWPPSRRRGTRRARWTGTCTSSTAPWSGRASTPYRAIVVIASLMIRLGQ